MRILNKRGMSPLIATVLLMAFAVALGGMIMNYTSDLDSSGGDECTNIQLQTNKFCYDGEQIQVETRNQGDVVVGSLSLLIDNPSVGSFNVQIPNSRLTSGGGRISKSIPFSVDGETSVSLMVSIESQGELFECVNPEVAKKPLPDCS